MPAILDHSFDFWAARTQKIHYTKYKKANAMMGLTFNNLSNVQKMVLEQNYETELKEGRETMGASVFLLCESQAVAAEKYTALIASNSTQP